VKCINVVFMFCIDAAHHFHSIFTNVYVQGTSYMGLQNLIKYYKSRCFDPDIGLPK